MGIFSKIKDALKKTKESLGGAIKSLFSRGKIGDEFYDELEEILISADISVTTAEETVEDLRAEVKKEKLKDEEYVISLLKDILEEKLTRAEVPEIEYPAVIMLIGVNGVGKTTTIGKLADYFLRNKKSVTVAAARLMVALVFTPFTRTLTSAAARVSSVKPLPGTSVISSWLMAWCALIITAASVGATFVREPMITSPAL